jgi:hypothetical protein
MQQHLFSIDEANALIPRLEILMGRLQQRAATLRSGIEQLAEETGRPAHDLSTAEIVELRPELQPVIEELEDLVGDIEECGGEFKGLELGLVDFPCEMNGELALLCWQFGEKEICYWHSVDGGFGGRQPLSERQASRSRSLQ